ncbi:hypothetical protein [Bradyrhizobium erythrophlei]|uniref:Uncharacterized protein n=1 Tax=Bradyrhizobium erythrophlei TaxID=1437360 RepID=A0A1M5NPW6_9BRAD|nr:hypothetical protein [Bradyrhizobium erythrophlei]SHG91591.1 hypothetical protein SAMN05443248_3075 [Bradyrhizobium erythrophlei]
MVRFRLVVTIRWWVYPLIELAKFNLFIGIPVDTDRLAQIIAKHGLKIKFKAE